MIKNLQRSRPSHHSNKPLKIESAAKEGEINDNDEIFEKKKINDGDEIAHARVRRTIKVPPKRPNGEESV